eukprot:105133-Rhodomonas_salina.1
MEALTTKQKATRGSRMRKGSEPPDARKGRSRTKPKQGAQKGGMSVMEEGAAAMAKEEAESVEIGKRFKAMAMKPDEPKLPVAQKDQVAGALARKAIGFLQDNSRQKDLLLGRSDMDLGRLVKQLPMIE